MKYLENTIELQSVEVITLHVFISFVVTFRWGINRWMYLQWPKLKKKKLIYCSTCFAFWLALAMSQNVTTAALAFLIFNFYGKNNND